MGAIISDHNAVLLTLKSGKPHPIRKDRKVRKIKSIVPAEFSNDILNSELTEPLPSHVNDIVSKYNDVLLELLDKHAPTKLRPVVQRLPQPWMNVGILEAKRVRRQYERRWRKSPLTVHRQAFKASCEDVKKKIGESKSPYFIKQIDACGKDQWKLFKNVNNLLGRGKPSSFPEYTTPIALAETFSEFFTTKISKIRTLLTDMEASTDELRCLPISSLLKSSPAQLCSFKPATIQEVTSVIKKIVNSILYP